VAELRSGARGFWRFVPPAAIMTLAVLALLVTAVASTRGWPLATRLLPERIGILAIGLAVLQLVVDLVKGWRRAPDDDAGSGMDLPVDRSVPLAVVFRRATMSFAWFFALVGMVWLFSFKVTVPLFLFLFLRLQSRESWLVSLLLPAAVTLIVVFGLFDTLLSVPWPEGAVWRLLGLRVR